MQLKVSIIVPCYNEAATLPVLLRRVMAAPLAGVERELIVVDDGSLDDTTRVLETFATDAGADLIVLRHAVNRGKGSAIATALARTTGDVVILQDADLEYDPGDYGRLLAPIVDGSASAVYGSRWLTRHGRRVLPGHWRYVAGNWLVTRATNLLFDARLTDQCTGYKVLAGDVARGLALQSTGFEVCSEITAKIRAAGWTIPEIPIGYTPRSVADGKKIRAIDAVRAIWTLVRLRLTLRPAVRSGLLEVRAHRAADRAPGAV